MPRARCTLVSAAVNMPADSCVDPPISFSDSRLTTLAPRSAADIAAAKPAPPAPMTTTSQLLICCLRQAICVFRKPAVGNQPWRDPPSTPSVWPDTYERSEEHTSELQPLMRIP